MKDPASLQAAPVPTSREAVLYVRVSSKEQEKEGFSIPAQRKLLTAYALEQGLEIVREFEDVETAKRAGAHSLHRDGRLPRESSCKVCSSRRPIASTATSRTG
jgi:hypothetical protein